ncbi:MAG: hypothetical protein JNL11_04065 [Bdellovibrionaceae bacterium]|nr:hypothetical protein [Pseudobdellovibrionaceae bacterium]
MKYFTLPLITATFFVGVFFIFFRPTESYLEQSSEVKKLNLGSCVDCKISKESPNTVELEDPDKCSRDRLYFQSSLKKIDPFLLKRRSDKEGGAFPMSCVGYIMRRFIDATSHASRFYSYCAKAVGAPVRNRKTHCVSEDYVSSVYNSYVDVMSCLDIPQTDLIPKLYNESGFHINTLGGGMDAGVGQLTGPAIASVQQLAVFDGENKTWLEMFKEEINKSDKPACRRVAKITSLFSKIAVGSEQRCALIAAPENPLKNVLYAGIFYHYMLRAQTGSRYLQGYTYLPKGDSYVRLNHKAKDIDMSGFFKEYKIKERLKELGISRPNMLALRQMMVTLGYNAGMETAFIYLDRYLKSRKSIKLLLKDSDFDFQKHFYSNWMKKSSKPEDEKRRVKELRQARSAPYRLPFPLYLRMVQRTGAPGYLSAVSQKLLLLDKEMGAGLCTTPNFLRF